MTSAPQKAQASDARDSLASYFNDIAKFKPLSRQREAELSARIQAGDMGARDKLVTANLRFVIDVAKKFLNRGLSLEDLISAGNEGLIKAAERFDGTKGYKFISYAVWWIKQSIQQTIAEQARIVRLPLNKLSQLKDISRAVRKLGQVLEREPSAEEIAAELDRPADEVQDTMLSAHTVTSLDEPFEDDDDLSPLSLRADDNQATPDSDVLQNSVRAHLEEVLASLEDRELYILHRYFGLDGSQALTLEQIGELMGLTRERVRQLKERALNKIKARYPELSEYLDEIES